MSELARSTSSSDCVVGFKYGFDDSKGAQGLLTSVSLRGVPGMEPCAELVRLRGGVRMRRPIVSNLAGELVREAIDEEEVTRWW